MPRWYWTNEKVVSVQQQQRLSFNTLTRQYRVGAGALYQNFATLTEAMALHEPGAPPLRHRAGRFAQGDQLCRDVRMRLDTTQLPKPFQLNSGRDWNIGSDWYRWTVTP